MSRVTRDNYFPVAMTPFVRGVDYVERTFPNLAKNESRETQVYSL